MADIIYILTNESMIDYIKIGKTTDLERRIKELDNTSVPLPFECFYACTVKDMNFVEKQLHKAFAPHRVRNNREFFKLSPIQAVAALKLVALEDITPNMDFVETKDDQVALDKARARRPNFNFKMLDIPIGSKLAFILDDTITATVVDNKYIELDGKIVSTSGGAHKFLPKTRHPVQGTLYWAYEGETLNERRIRLETE